MYFSPINLNVTEMSVAHIRSSVITDVPSSKLTFVQRVPSTSMETAFFLVEILPPS